MVRDASGRDGDGLSGPPSRDVRPAGTGANARSGAVDSDTIAAVATPIGRGGVSMVRVSGAGVAAIAQTVLGSVPPPKTPRLSAFLARSGETVDRGLVLYFAAPGSFTGEDVLELHGHGGVVVTHEVLKLVLDAGARLARPGEFSERAFLNGKLDLLQAEAIADLINSGSAAAARSAMRSLDGEFSDRIYELAEELHSLRVYVEAALDFPDEDLDLLQEGQIAERQDALLAALRRLQERAREGALLATGASVVLAGAPNVGKSSLLNALAGDARAIVTDIPGTTRDVLPADLVINGLPVRVLDTAGIRPTDDPVEREGVKRAQAEVDRADLTIEVFDARELVADATLTPTIAGVGAHLCVANKCDLLADGQPLPDGCLPVSALRGTGLDELRRLVAERLGYSGAETGFAARERHLRALAAAERALTEARDRMATGVLELVADALGEAHRHLGTIVGTVSADELLGAIFGSFCIGK